MSKHPFDLILAGLPFRNDYGSLLEESYAYWE